MAEQALSLSNFSPFNNTDSTAARFVHEFAKRAPADLNNLYFNAGGSTAVDTNRVIVFPLEVTFAKHLVLTIRDMPVAPKIVAF
ncbi:hypothetical protein [Ruegeria atlantica]|uniref:hypothetical protein n=1 Tax=Ruegeria atlantica TaxID=81569 RepID=UPI00147E2C34|nr:hypothetical protein [Ruegeria atlantica]